MIVETAAGKVQGLAKRGVWQFRGIPYARAERFRAPQPPEPWPGVRDATAFGLIAPQNPSPTEAMLGGQDRPAGEDCLALNVFTSQPGDGARPVMVWIHGGAFVAGSGSIVWYDGSNLAREGDVVVVTINYRLGALGFLHLGHLDPAFAGSGANGIRDQVAALRWVRDNIAAFGGDPGNVTVFGESAGGMSVGTLLGTPAAAGLFRTAIAQSGAADHAHAPEVAEWVTAGFLAALDLTPASAEALLSLPVTDLLRAQAAIETRVQTDHRRAEGPGIGALTFQPVVDGAVMPRPPLDAVRDGAAAGVRLVAGTTADEWNLFHLRERMGGPLSEDALRRRLARLVGADRAGDVIDAYRTARPGLDPDGVACAVMTDHVFRQPAIRLAEAQAPHAPSVAMYRFDLPSAAMGGILGACHAIDVPFVFDNLDRGGVEMLLGDVDDGARRLAARTRAAWAAAARRGAPAHDDLAWPAYDRDERLTCLLDREPQVAADPEAALRALWAELRPAAAPAGS
ncbi:MAG TPA: carboxylesterase/lipase family protein [Acidimicrobiales bacterium]